MPSVAELLDFEAAHPQRRGRNGWKEEAIRRRFGIAPARYFQLLHRAAASAEGQRHDGITAHRVLERIAA